MGGWKKARKYDSVCYIVYRHVAPREAQENIPIINFGACALVGFAVRIQMQGVWKKSGRVQPEMAVASSARLGRKGSSFG